jgi:nickel superoxide dismutase
MNQYISHCLSKILPSISADAHCDIPCGIYDPTAAKIAAKTVERMVMQIEELTPPEGFPQAFDIEAMKALQNMLVRRIRVKEDHAEQCKRELLILWTDFFKPEHLEKHPELHEIFWKAAKLCSKNKQEINDDAAKELVEVVDEIAKVFYEAKGAPEKYAAYKKITDTVF